MADVTALPDPPYPADVRARGWRFELDMERVKASDTWSLAGPVPELRPWLLMIWATAWGNHPIGLPGDERVLAAQIGMPLGYLQTYRDILLRGWTMANDGRLYHPTITALVAEMMAKRAGDAERMAKHRARKGGDLFAEVTPASRVTSGEVQHLPPTTYHLQKTKSLAPGRISFDPDADGNAFGGWVGIQAKDVTDWEAAFPACAVKTELAQMAEWVKANPANRKSQWRRFIVSWLTRSQDRAPRVLRPNVPHSVSGKKRPVV